MSHIPPTIVNRKTDPFDLYAGRPTVFGNPWVLGPDGTRDEVCDRYDTWLRTGRDFGHPEATEARRSEVLRRLPELAGKRIDGIMGCLLGVSYPNEHLMGLCRWVS